MNVDNVILQNKILDTVTDISKHVWDASNEILLEINTWKVKCISVEYLIMLSISMPYTMYIGLDKSKEC